MDRRRDLCRDGEINAFISEVGEQQGLAERVSIRLVAMPAFAY
jgi:hypothetical protein